MGQRRRQSIPQRAIFKVCVNTVMSSSEERVRQSPRLVCVYCASCKHWLGLQTTLSTLKPAMSQNEQKKGQGWPVLPTTCLAFSSVCVSVCSLFNIDADYPTSCGDIFIVELEINYVKEYFIYNGMKPCVDFMNCFLSNPEIVWYHSMCALWNFAVVIHIKKLHLFHSHLYSIVGPVNQNGCVTLCRQPWGWKVPGLQRGIPHEVSRDCLS
jgi:hypothetical protein